MDESTTARLVAINRTFYARFHGAFDETRTRPWPGWRRVAARTSPRTVLDLGCGNGRWADFLAVSSPSATAYEGWDDCEPLLDRAQARTRTGLVAHFQRVDLLGLQWPVRSADLVGAFGILHHVPSVEARGAFLTRALHRVAPGGHLAVCFWRFAPHGQPRVATAPWQEAGIAPEAVEPGDHLVRWRRGGEGLRYCHHTDDDEIDRLLAPLGGEVVDRFDDDGEARDMNRYLILQRPG